MASAKVANPTANLYALLADDADTSDVNAVVVEKKKKPTPAAGSAPKPDAGAVPTPGEKAKAREARKAANPSPAPRENKPQAAPQGSVAPRGGNPRPRGGLRTRRAVDAAHRDATPDERPDRQSQGKYSRNAPPKKGGSGKANLGDPVTESIKDAEAKAEGNSEVDAWGDKVDDAQAEAAASDATVVEAPVEEEEKTRTFEEYLKAKEAANAALLAKIGVAAPKTEAVSTASSTTEESPSSAPKQQRKGEKFIDASEIFKIVTGPPPARGGGARGGRGGRGGRGAPRGGASDRSDRSDRPPRADRPDRPPRAEGAPRKPRGAAKEAPAPARGGRGTRGGRGALDTSSNRQFPSLAQ